jgi:ABC-type multidrug transport system ATPase subunit
MAHIIQIQDLVFEYPSNKQRALDGLSLNIEQGSYTILLGTNGSGKSTLLKSLAGVVNWKSGSVFINGQDRCQDLPNFNAQQIFISEDIILPSLSVKSLISLYQDFWKDFDPKEAERILSLGEIDLNKSVNSHSKGQKILIQFALAVATGLKLIFMDELSAPLDPYIRLKVMSEIKDLNQKKGVTVFMATNVIADLQGFDANLVLLKGGKVFKQGTISELRSQFPGAQTAEDIFVQFIERGRNA